MRKSDTWWTFNQDVARTLPWVELCSPVEVNMFEGSCVGLSSSYEPFRGSPAPQWNVRGHRGGLIWTDESCFQAATDEHSGFTGINVSRSNQDYKNTWGCWSQACERLISQRSVGGGTQNWLPELFVCLACRIVICHSKSESGTRPLITRPGFAPAEGEVINYILPASEEQTELAPNYHNPPP